jgi:predicted Zn-ribbon and HTH transcriptional regulator
MFNQNDLSMLGMAILLGIFIGVPVLVGVLRGRRTPRMTTTTCRHCGYDRRGLSKQAECPECGLPAGIEGPGRPPDQDHPSCRGCGHLLVNLPWNATCPECGLPSAALPRFHRLRRRHWLTLGRILTFVLGTAWLGVGLLFMISAIAFFFR